MAQLIPRTIDDQQLVAIVEEISRVESLLRQGLLREDELAAITDKAEAAYEAASDHNSIQYRKYDKLRRQTTRWMPVRTSGYAEDEDGYYLYELKQQIIELLHIHEVRVEPKEVFLPAGDTFTGRLAIRNILSRAGATIDIKDDYLFSANKTTKNLELFAVIAPYLDGPLNIKVRLLGPSRELETSIVSDVATFIRQYPHVELMGYSRSLDGIKQTHDRFIILDGKEVFASGASIKDLGLAQSSINQINDTAVIAQYIRQFDEWWANATAYPSLSAQLL